jgi:hypothetical protein
MTDRTDRRSRFVMPALGAGKVFVDYDGRLGSRLQEHSVSGGLRIRFW